MTSQGLSSLLQKLSSWFARTPVAELADPLADVPPGILNHLRTAANQLPTPQPYRDAIVEALNQALQEWQTNPDIENNNLVVLGRPVEDIVPILKASLKDSFPDSEVRFCLGGYQRPADPLSITQHLKRELEPKVDDDQEAIATPVTQTDLEEQELTIMVVPSLEQCFLRCIQGWEGIEYLQTMTTRDNSRFWVFGCNHWAWSFLERVCQVSAYLEQTVSLPELSGEALQTWLAPLCTEAIETQADGPSIQLEPVNADQWSSLASNANGIASTAARLWLKALRIRAFELTEDGTIRDETTVVNLLPIQPTLPDLVALEVMDRYLLHALLIHREMTLSHLSISLGEVERTIRSRLQVLRRAGVILQRGRRFRVNPAHYPKLYSELSNNNFLTGKV